jgi:hypothetical protein
MGRLAGIKRTDPWSDASAGLHFRAARTAAPEVRARTAGARRRRRRREHVTIVTRRQRVEPSIGRAEPATQRLPAKSGSRSGRAPSTREPQDGRAVSARRHQRIRIDPGSIPIDRAAEP